MTTPSEILDEAGDETEACPHCSNLPSHAYVTCGACKDTGRVPKPKAEQPSAEATRKLVVQRQKQDPGDDLRRQIAKLLQVAVEAIRLVHGSELGDHYSHEPCGECGLGGHGSLREALTAALGVGYTKLVWGNDMNADWDGLRAALSAIPQPAESKPAELTCPHCLESLIESEGVEGPHGDLWHYRCLESWREEA